jgi:hypothetical protein
MECCYSLVPFDAKIPASVDRASLNNLRSLIASVRFGRIRVSYKVGCQDITKLSRPPWRDLIQGGCVLMARREATVAVSFKNFHKGDTC